MNDFEFYKEDSNNFTDQDNFSQENQNFLEAKYYGDVAQFRAEVIQRMLGCNALDGVVSWLLYQDKNHTDSNVLVDERDRQTLIVIARSRSDMPNIKILTNTEYWLEESVAFITEDITIDRDGDSQMLIDVVYFDHEGSLLSNQNSDFGTQSAWFWLDADNKLSVVNINDYTPIISVVAKIEQSHGFEQVVDVFPFGICDNIEDKIASLDWANNILNDTKQARLITQSNKKLN